MHVSRSTFPHFQVDWLIKVRYSLIMAPVFFSAYDYILLGGAISHLGAQYSILRPSWYFIFFLIADLISLILQAVGGGQAASTAAVGIPTTSATNIMVAGIIFQLISMIVFVSLGFDFVLRASSKRPYEFRERQLTRVAEKAGRKVNGTEQRDGEAAPKISELSTENKALDEGGIAERQATRDDTRMTENPIRWWILLTGAMISSIMILTRGVYRSIELRQGWTGYLITHQIYQNVLDGIPMFIAVAVFNFIHPLFILGRKSTWRGYH